MVFAQALPFRARDDYAVAVRHERRVHRQRAASDRGFMGEAPPDDVLVSAALAEASASTAGLSRSKRKKLRQKENKKRAQAASAPQ